MGFGHYRAEAGSRSAFRGKARDERTRRAEILHTRRVVPAAKTLSYQLRCVPMARRRDRG